MTIALNDREKLFIGSDYAERLNDANIENGTAVYLVSRAFRCDSNPSLSFAASLAIDYGLKLVVCALVSSSHSPARADFLRSSFAELSRDYSRTGISFYECERPEPEHILRTLKSLDCGALIVDYDPLKSESGRNRVLAEKAGNAVFSVDSSNIVPSGRVSPKQEYSARTIRPKILGLLPEYPYDFPKSVFPASNFIEPVAGLLPVGICPASNRSGQKAAIDTLNSFISEKLEHYDNRKNNPASDALSNLSPFINLGMISPGYVASRISSSSASPGAKSAFLEEFIVRRELSANYCRFNNDYDNFSGFPAWAKNTLTLHLADKRNPVYTLDELENFRTCDPIWNSAQYELVTQNKMHGYLRMYWAKMILRWSPDPQTAQDVAIFLNDKYALDGYSPNGFTGIAWSVGGVHDRPWFEREIFGKVRCMTYESQIKKINLAELKRRIGFHG